MPKGKMRCSALACIAVVALYWPSGAMAATYHVATTGSNSNGGSAGAPFATISRCATAMVAGDTCIVHAGTYRETVTPPSGTTLMANTGETVIVDGSDPVSGWTASSGNIYSANVSLNTALPGNQVFSSGIMLPQARWPNASSDLLRPNWATMGSGTTYTAVHDLNLPTINWTGATVHISSGTNSFAHQTATVTTSSSGVINTDFNNLGTCPFLCAQQGGRYYVVGVLAALDTAGEWFFDSTTNKLYLWAPQGGMPVDIRVKQRSLAFDLRAKSNVTIRGFTIFASTIEMSTTSSNNVIDQINASYLSHYESLPKPAPGELVASDGDFDIVASREESSGIIVRGTGNSITNSVLTYSAGNGIRLGGSSNTVQNNLISQMGYMGSYATGISASGSDQVIRHNTIHDTGRDGVTVEFHVGGYNFKNNDISYNNIYNSSTLNPDSGGIYFCCSLDASGTKLHHNWTHDATPDTSYPPAGIYVDNSASYLDIFQNVSWDNFGSGIFLHGAGSYSRGNLVHDNTILTGQDLSIRVLNINDAAGTRVENNKVVSPINVSNVAGNLFTSNNTSAASGATEGISASVGCNFGGCVGETPPVSVASGALLSTVEPSVSNLGIGTRLVVARDQASSQLAAGSYAASGWSGWVTLGGILRAAPSVVTLGVGYASIFVIGNDAAGANAIYARSYDNGSWGSFYAVNGPGVGIASATASASRSSTSIDLFAVGGDNALWWCTFSGTSCSSWTSLGGILSAAPAVVASPGGGLDVVVLGVQNTLYRNTYADGAWTGFSAVSSPPGGATSAPALAYQSGMLELLVRGGDGALWETSFSGGSWSAWTSLGGALLGGPALASTSAGELEVFVRGTDDQIYQKTKGASGWPVFFTALGAP